MFQVLIVVCLFTSFSEQQEVTTTTKSVENVSDFFALLQNVTGPQQQPHLLVVRITETLDYVYPRSAEEITLRRSDVTSVTFQCDSNQIEWRCSGDPTHAGLCLVIHPDTKNVTILGCRMYGGIQARDRNPENSTMSLSIRDGMMDGG
eukprot:PhF_6_TR5729/c0_g1_i2/m.8443